MCAQKRIKGESIEKGEKGEARLIKVSANKARVKFLESGKEYPIEVKQGDYDTEGVTLPNHVPFADIPLPKDGKASSINISATMTKDGKRVLYASPWSGEFEVKFIGFKAEENSAPVPDVHQGKKGKAFSTFTPILEVVEGGWKGLKYFNSLYLNFGADENEMLAVTGGGEGSDNLADFGDCIGVDFNSIPYSENPLPEIQEKALEIGRTFKIVVVKGWIKSYLAGFSDDFVDEVLDAETVEETNPILED